MEALTSVPIVHHFDTDTHRISCGVPGFDRSTKHARSVTCPSCLRLIRGERKSVAGVRADTIPAADLVH